MSDFSELKKYFEENPEALMAILDSDRQTLLNAPEVKMLHGKYFTDFWKERPNKKLTYVIFFNESLIPDLDFASIKNNLTGAVTETLKTHRIIQVDKSCSVISSSAVEITHELLLTMSNKGDIVFFFGEEGIDVVVKGKIFPRINVFYDESDRIQFLKKYHIANIQTCLKEYETFIKEPGINGVFFASKVLIAKIQAVDPPNNTLHNKPEKILRDNLISFLNRNTQHTFSKENELNDQRELDLYTEVEGKKYLIEVKWLGQTINDTENGFTQKVTDVSARDGVTQTLEYIKHLIEEMNYNVHCGYLCVFDARESKKKPINYDNFKFVHNELLPYFTKHFKKLDEILVERTN
jgi:hypothetical protein